MKLKSYLELKFNYYSGWAGGWIGHEETKYEVVVKVEVRVVLYKTGYLWAQMTIFSKVLKSMIIRI